MINIFSIFSNTPKIFTPAQKGFQKSKINFRNIGKGTVHTPINIKYGDDTGTLLVKKISPDSMRIVDADKICTTVQDVEDIELGSYKYYIDWKEKSIKDGLISVESNVRKKGLGEILRLSSLIEFRENDLNKIDIYAVEDAVPFHMKYKFKPNFTNKKEILDELENIKENPNVIKYFRKRAESLERSIPPKLNELIESKKLKEINKFFYAYIKQHLFNWEKTKFTSDIPMVLTKETVNGAAGFFNKLFEKHGIDYRL